VCGTASNNHDTLRIDIVLILPRQRNGLQIARESIRLVLVPIEYPFTKLETMGIWVLWPLLEEGDVIALLS
jgi:hypothetical protein